MRFTHDEFGKPIPFQARFFIVCGKNFRPLTIILTGVAIYLVFYSIFPAGIWDKPLGAR